MTTVRYRIPREHGAYVVLIASWVFGVLYTHPTDTAGSALALTSALSIFLLQDPFKQFSRPKRGSNPFASTAALTLALLGAVSGTAMIARTPSVAMCVVPLTVIGALYFVMLRNKRSAIARSFVGFAGLTLLTPMTMLASGSAASLTALFLVWIFATLFFCTSIYCVAIRLSESGAMRNALLYHGIAFAIVSILVRSQLLPISAVWCMLVPLVRFVLIVFTRERYTRLPIKYIGIQETIVALLALGLTIVIR
ncbi:MAG: YwiC-like family protein [Bacteroidetes bacterium]|nr:YwiC-like family protein [Bacteroidota bacterium]